jgi:nicotinamide mononucleotide transporter
MELHAWTEWPAVTCGILYLTLAIRENRAGWIFGGISTGIYVFIMYDARLFADMLLNIFYTAMAVKGWIDWGKPDNKLPISILTVQNRWIGIFVTLGIAGAMGYFFRQYTEADYPFADSFVAATAVAATWLSTRKKLENWPVWIISNSTAVILFYVKGLLPTVFLTFIYLTLSVAGWKAWNKQWKKDR